VGLAFVSVLGLDFTTSGTPVFRPLYFGGATMTLIGMRWNPAYLAVQVSLLLASGLFAVLVLPRLRGGRLSLGLPALLALVAIVAALVTAPQWGPAETRTVPGAAEPPTHCFGQRPVTCVYDEHRRDAGAINAAVSRLESAAAQAGYSTLVFARVEESSRTYAPAGRGVVSFPHLDSLETSGRVDPIELAEAMVMPLRCPQLSNPAGPPGDSYGFRQASVVATWLRIAGLDSEAIVNANSEHITDRLSAARVAAIMHDFAGCKLEGAV
jgi:hypothetical protein